MITPADLEALRAAEVLRQFAARYCMGHERLLVARHYGLDPQRTLRLPWEEWLPLWEQYKAEAGVIRTADGPRKLEAME